MNTKISDLEKLEELIQAYKKEKDVKQQSYHVKPCNSAREFDAGIVKHLNREIEVLSSYLPEQLSMDELKKIIDEVFDKVKPTSMKDMGTIMKELKPLVNGKADMKDVNTIVREKLN